MAPKCKNGDAGNSDIPKRAISTSIKWKGKSSSLYKVRKQIVCWVAKIHGKNKPICEIVKKEKEIHHSFPVTPQSTKVTVTMPDKYLVKMGKH
jgi:hypothetical protein